MENIPCDTCKLAAHCALLKYKLSIRSLMCTRFPSDLVRDSYKSEVEKRKVEAKFQDKDSLNAFINERLN